MKKHSALLILLTGVGCATSDEWNSSDAGQRFCERLSEFAAAVPRGEQRSVEFVVGGEWLVDHYKQCGPTDGDAAVSFCGWLMNNSSAEFMEANVSIALSCLQGQSIVGHIGNTGVEYWQGKAVFFSPKLSVENVSVTLEYELGYFENKPDQQRMKITVDAE